MCVSSSDCLRGAVFHGIGVNHVSGNPVLLLTRYVTSYPMSLSLSLLFYVMGMITPPLGLFYVLNDIMTIKKI